MIKDDAQPQANRCMKKDGAQGKCWHTLFGISIFFLLMWITGAVLLSLGVAFEHEAQNFSPRDDFTPMQGKCVVTAVTHVADQRQDKNPYCVDVYTYSFRTPGDETNFTSGADEKQHDKGTWCENSAQITASVSVVELRTFYKCGNAGCVKILDPTDEYATKKARARLFLVLGVSFLVVGLAMWCVLGCLIVRMKSKEDVAKVGIKEVVGVKPSACSTFDAAVYQKA